MTEIQTQELFTDVYELLDIFNEFNPIQADGNYILEAVKPTIIEMIDYIVKSAEEAAALKDWLDKTDFWTAPASTRFHGNFKGGLSLHTLKVIQQALIFTKPLIDNFLTSPGAKNYDILAEKSKEKIIYQNLKFRFYYLIFTNFFLINIILKTI